MLNLFLYFIISILIVTVVFLLNKKNIYINKIFQLKLKINDLENNLKQEIAKNTNHDNLEKKYLTEFENISNKILKEVKADLLNDNNKNIDEIIKPLQNSITNFEKNYSEKYDKDLRDRISLKTEVKNLFNLNQKISNEANNLAMAIKGDNKYQGRWGEVILEKLLENSGLRKDIEYFSQNTNINENGTVIRPDIIVKLPNENNIIIDSKVSLKDYENYCRTNNQLDLDQHINSIKKHVKNLAEKSYHQISTYDFIILFLPIESALNIALQHDHDIFWWAWNKKIIITGPMSFHSTLKIIYSNWQNYKINQNASLIAKESGILYDKFVALIESLNQVRKYISSSQNSLESSFIKISGKGGIYSKIDNIKKLGAKTDKTIFIEENEEVA